MEVITASVKKKSVKTYTYDENDRLTKLYTVVSTKENENLVQETENYVVLYEYNKGGQLVCKKSYREGRELTQGISIEEYVYDKNGYNIKSVLYNSLDPSSKIYKECEMDEDGKVLNEFDQSGMYRTIYDGYTAIQPNGVKTSYGYSSFDGNSAITMSAENGEENSIQKLYTNELLTRVISGDDVYDYTYDYKGRVINVKTNGEDYVDYTYFVSDDGLSERVEAIYSNGKKKTLTKDPVTQDTYLNDEDAFGLYSKTIRKDILESIVNRNENGWCDITEFTYNENGHFLTEGKRMVIDDYTGTMREIYKENYTYDKNGNLTEKQITFDGQNNETISFDYDSETNNLNLIAFADDANIELKRDVLKRNKGKNILWDKEKIYSEDITYLKQGDHATVLPLTISYGKKTDSGFAINENIKYKYDNMSNITKVYKNGEFVTEYKYDALCRLV
ncbi:MAG: hypothetical protein IKA02_05780, partial [Clostridia bacterium]|nr:hypothetical protein [Clostridia bacterium]